MGKPIISYKKTDLYDRVVNEYEVFENYYDFLIFCAVVGYRDGEPKRTGYAGDRSEGTKGEIGLQNVYSNTSYRVIMASLAFHDTGDPNALVNRDVMANDDDEDEYQGPSQKKILAQYAAGGLEVAEEEFGHVAGDPTDAIMNYIKSKESPEDDYQGELGKIVDSFSELDSSKQQSLSAGK